MYKILHLKTKMLLKSHSLNVESKKKSDGGDVDQDYPKNYTELIFLFVEIYCIPETLLV